MKLIISVCVLLVSLFLFNPQGVLAINKKEDQLDKMVYVRNLRFAKNDSSGSNDCMQVFGMDNQGKFATIGYISEAEMQSLFIDINQNQDPNKLKAKLKESCQDVNPQNSTDTEKKDVNEPDANVKIEKTSIKCDTDTIENILQMTFGKDANAYKNIHINEVIHRIRSQSEFFTRVTTGGSPQKEKIHEISKCVAEYLKKMPSSMPSSQSKPKIQDKPQEPVRDQTPQEKDLKKAIKDIEKYINNNPSTYQKPFNEKLTDRFPTNYKNPRQIQYLPIAIFDQIISPNEIKLQNPKVKGISKSNEDEGIIASESGVYTFFKDNVEIQTTEIIISEEDEEILINFFKDKNNNKKRDDDESILSSDEINQITVSKQQEIENYKINAGWNSFNFKGLPDLGIKTAKDFLESAKAQNLEIIHMAKFDNGKFLIYSLREEDSEYAEDFSLIPGKGYMVFSYTSGDYSLNYQPYTSSVPIEFQNGWNLIGVHSTEEYTSHSLVNKLKSSKLNPEVISDFDNGVYRSVIWADPLFYGNEFNVIEKKSYFVKINFQESPGDNNSMIFTP